VHEDLSQYTRQIDECNAYLKKTSDTFEAELNAKTKCLEEDIRVLL